MQAQTVLFQLVVQMFFAHLHRRKSVGPLPLTSNLCLDILDHDIGERQNLAQLLDDPMFCLPTRAGGWRQT